MSTLSTAKRHNTTEASILDVRVLSCNSSSGARSPRIEGITTPKEFKAIVEAISVAKTLDYPVTTALIQSLSGIKRQSDNRRVTKLIESILELNQLHDDIYTDDRCRVVYRDEDGDFLVYPDGSIDKDAEPTLIEQLKKIETMKKGKIDENNKSVFSVEPIAYRDQEMNTFIPKLLSSSFIEAINEGKSHRYGSSLKDHPLKFYDIRPYRIRLNGFSIDPKYEKHKTRLIHHLLGSGLDKNNIFDLRTFSDVISALFGYVALKYLPQYKKNLRSSRSIEMHGKHLFNLYIATATKNGYIGHRAAGIRFFVEHSMVPFHMELFKPKKVPMENHYYKVYEPTETLDTIAKEVFNFVKELNFLEPEGRQIEETHDIFSFDFEEMMDINVRDRMTILAHSIGVKDGAVWVHTKPNDNHFNRVYSLMTTIKSESRLGLIEYDMSTAQQTIMMSVVNDWESYPLHARLITDKQKFRRKIMQLLDCDYDKAKEHITALDNGREIDYYGKKVKVALLPYYNEAQKLSRAFMSIVEEEHPFVYKQAHKLAKEAKENDFSLSGKRFYGTVFHAWTHFERQIRNAMKFCFAQPVYDVHDAVYSREQVDFELMELAVLEQTEFYVKIEA